MKRIFVEAHLVSFRKHKNLKGELVRSRVQRSVGEGMKRCGKSRCLICKFVITFIIIWVTERFL